MSSKEESRFESLYEQYAPMVVQICRGYVRGDRDIAADLVQDVFIHVWKGLGNFRGEASHKTWIYRITVNTCLKYLRVKKRPENSVAIPPAAPGEALQAEREQDRLYQAIGRLNGIDRLLVMLVLDELDYPEIAEIMGISEGNLRVKIHRVKRKLKGIMCHDSTQ